MKKLQYSACFCLAAVFVSCAASPRVRENRPPEMPPQIASAGIPEGNLDPANLRFDGSRQQVPERPQRPEVPELIMGKGLIMPEDMAAFLLSFNPETEKDFVDDLALFYSEEAAIEGVNHDAAFAQMCLETGFLRFGGLVTLDMNNFCGLGSIGPGQNGEIFPDPRTGVRAHIQHLKAYATDAPLEQELVDPRYRYVRYGSSPYIKGLSGTWAADPSYAEKINSILERLYNFSFES